jgi:hypothetical protein
VQPQHLAGFNPQTSRIVEEVHHWRKNDRLPRGRSRVERALQCRLVADRTVAHKWLWKELRCDNRLAGLAIVGSGERSSFFRFLSATRIHKAMAIR